MRLFSEKVVPTYTSSNLNILTVKDYNEVFFDVFEFEINGKKFIAEKVSTYKGSPVVDIPLVLEGKEFTASFVLQRGKFEILFNKANSTFVGPAVQEAKESIIQFVEHENEIEDIVFEKKESILKEIHQAKQSAEQYVKELKQQKLRETTKFFNDKQQILDEEIGESRKSLLNEFLSLVENVKSEFYEFNEGEKTRLVLFIKESLDSLSDGLSKDIEDKNEQAEKVFSEKINELATNVLSGVLLKEIDSNNKKTNKDITSRFEAITTSLNKLTEQRDSRLKGEMKEILGEYSGSLNGLEQANVELNDLINKSSNKALSRIGNVKTQLEESILYTGNDLKSTITNTKEELLDKIQFTENKIDAVEKTADIITNKFTVVERTVNAAKDEINAAVDIVNNSDAKLDTVRTELQESIHNISGLISTDIKKDITKLKKDLTEQISITEDKVDLTGKNTTLVEQEVHVLKRTVDKSATDTDDRFNALIHNVDANVVSVDKKIKSVSKNITEQLGVVTNSIDRLTVKSISLDSNIKELEDKIILAEDNIITFYDERINLVETKVTDLTEENKQYFINLIEESKQALLEQISNIKVDVPNIIVEQSNGSQEVDLKGVKSELEKIIGTKFTTEISALKRLIEMSSGGGSVAKQFANGGTMNGNLNVTGTIFKNGVDILTLIGGGGGAYTLVNATSSIQPVRGFNTASCIYSNVAGGCNNTVYGNYSSVVGGLSNKVNCSDYSSIAGGCSNNICWTPGSNVAGGYYNTVCGSFSNIAGGYCNTSSGDYTAYTSIGGGFENTICWFSPGSTIAGGKFNTASGYYSTIAGGCFNKTCAYMSTVGGGYCNTASGDYSTVAGGCYNTTCGVYSSVLGGLSSIAYGQYSTITGGSCNAASGSYSNIAGGRWNTTKSDHDTIGGGWCNLTCTSSCYYGSNTIGGGSSNTISSYYACHTIGGGFCNCVCVSGPQFGGAIGGGAYNSVKCGYSTIGGGNSNEAWGWVSTIGGGSTNTASNSYATIGGGSTNKACGLYSTIGGGFGNTITCSGYWSTITGGRGNSASSYYSTVAGGQDNSTSSCYSIVAGGLNNNITATGNYSGILGGCSNQVSHINSFTIGSSLTSTAANTTYMNNVQTSGDLTVQGTLSAKTYLGMLASTPIVVTNGVISLSTTLPNNYTFSSTTRPTSNGTGVPLSASLITRSDGDFRYAISPLRQISFNNWSYWSSTTTTGGSIQTAGSVLRVEAGNGSSAGKALASFSSNTRHYVGIAPTGTFTGIDFANKVNCNFAAVSRSFNIATSINWAFIFGELSGSTATAGLSSHIIAGAGSSIGWVGLQCLSGNVTIVTANGTNALQTSSTVDTWQNGYNNKGYRLEILSGTIYLYNSSSTLLGTLTGAPTTSKGLVAAVLVDSTAITSQIGIIVQNCSFDW